MPFQKASPSRLPARSVLLAAHSRQRSPPATRTPRRTQNLLAGCIFDKRYLKQNHKVLYYNLLTSGKLNSYLADIEQQAQQLFLQLVKDLADKENVTEELKSIDMMLWVQKMNNIRNRATEIVSAELIYTV